MIGLEAYLTVGAILFAAGITAVLSRRNAIAVLIGIELMLNAVNLSLVTFGRELGQVTGQDLAVNTLSFVPGARDGFERLADPVTHRRRVVFVKPAFWLVIDELSAEGRHRYDQHWHFGPEATLEEAEDLSVTACYENGAVTHILQSA